MIEDQGGKFHIDSLTAGPPAALHLSDVPIGLMRRHTCMRCSPVGESDVSWSWQDSLCTALSQKGRQSKTHAGGTCASHLIHRHFLICPCWDQSSAAAQPDIQIASCVTSCATWTSSQYQGQIKVNRGTKKEKTVYLWGTCWDVNNHLGWHL